ncbi:Zinc finger protein [Plakobranchus ocellatus]|uniref:Zinc finger protein n=1 Tax=Plakobranchus ocellatus TaxID=259542 RepID=A0AAV3YE80_9GAST|nr:Zinc finger protein [Plakobranchus ocellatus]
MKDGCNRTCIDYRRLNKLIVFDSHSRILPADVFQGMENDRYFSYINSSKVVRQEDMPKTAFATIHPACELPRVQFGMMISVSTHTHTVKMLMRGMNHVLGHEDELLVYTPS